MIAPKGSAALKPVMTASSTESIITRPMIRRRSLREAASAP